MKRNCWSVLCLSEFVLLTVALFVIWLTFKIDAFGGKEFQNFCYFCSFDLNAVILVWHLRLISFFLIFLNPHITSMSLLDCRDDKTWAKCIYSGSISKYISHRREYLKVRFVRNQAQICTFWWFFFSSRRIECYMYLLDEIIEGNLYAKNAFFHWKYNLM